MPLTRWASLPNDFWKQVAGAVPAEPVLPSPDVLLAKQEEQQTPGPREPLMTGTREISRAAVGTAEWSPQTAVHLALSQGVTLVVEGVDPRCWNEQILTRLAPAVENLVETLRRLGLTPSNGVVSRQTGSQEPVGEQGEK